MRIIYILSVLLLGTGFFGFKKSDEKLNIIKWITIFIISLMGYNITICMVLGLLKITCHLWLLSSINAILGFALGFKAFKNKDLQKYTVRKQDLVGLAILCAIFAIIVVKEIKPQDRGLKYAAIDSAVHYRAAKHFADNLMIFINCEDKTIYNFNVMQTGAYINDGLLMNIVHGLFGTPEYYVYEMFEITILFLSGLAFYSLIIEKIKGKLGFVLTMFLMWLFLFAYPYNSYMFGFSYLSLGVVFVTTLIMVVQMLFDKDKINLPLVVSLISFLAMGVIFSYCLFVPGVFAAVCIYIFIKDFKQDGKSFLKIFKKRTLIVTGILLAITVLGIGYLFVPTFFIADQTNLVASLKNPGGMYSELYKNFLFYIFFGVLYIIDTILKIRKKEFKLEFLDAFSIVFGMYYIVVWLGMFLGFVSDYYFFKLYYVLWVCILAITIRLVNEYTQKKYFNIIIPIYEGIWVVLVILTIIFKAGNVLTQEKKQTLPNYVGIYFDQNYDFKGLIFAFNNLAKEQIEVMEFVKTLKDVKLDNILLISGSNYERAWSMAICDFRSDNIKYGQILEDATLYSIQDGLDRENVDYIIRVNESYDLDEFEDKSNFEILFQNSRGYVLKKK